MKPLMSILLLLLTLQVTGQTSAVIHELLSNKKFQPFKDFVDSATKRNIGCRWSSLRDVVADYQEGVVKIEEYTVSNRIKNYQINLLATDREIIYYNYTKTVYRKTGDDQRERNDSTIASYSNEQLYRSFQMAYQRIYDIALNQSELFLTSVVYGDGCGIAGVLPQEMQMMISFLENDRMDSVRSWLKSPNAEKQLYAIHGYRILTKAGYTLSTEEKYLIQKVKQKEGTAYTCGGCLFSEQSIRETVEGIESIPRSYLYTLNNNQGHKQEPLQMSISFMLAALILFIAHRKHKQPESEIKS